MIVYCIAAGIYFIISTFLSQETLYSVNGTAISGDDAGMIVQLSVTFGVIYMFGFLLSDFLIRKLHLRRWKYNILRYIALLLMVVVTYPIAVQLIFPSIMITFRGAIYIAFLVIGIWFLQTPLFKRRIVSGDF